MKFSTYMSWALVGLFFMSTINAGELSDKEEVLFLETPSSDDNIVKSKRPFCNAFTGCGKKRNYDNSVERSRNRLTPKISPIVYRALMQTLDEEIRRDNDHRLNIDNIFNTNDYDSTGYYPDRKLPRKRFL
ncbi:uncharacterized protein CCAP [Chelonus insularis]|uniref:uncharacterized protein CCAP n=1 Tax=Chelonus insularis TaxID=460826 RepID=UPI00158A267A|nr:uncharacterized protein LOC118070667 [Chelonus insularis]